MKIKINKEEGLTFYLFEFSALIISIAMIIWHFILLAILDNKDIPISPRIIPHSNMSWTFTQFTWWTNILITIWLLFKLVFVKLKKNNKAIQIIFGTNASMYWLSYITVVGTLFAAGTIFLMIKNFNNDIPKNINTIPRNINIQNIIITIFVHGVNPFLYILMYIYSLKKGLLNININNKFWIWVLKRFGIGMIFPTIYMIFYISYGLTNYDPYPVSDIKDAQGWWIGLVVPVVFISVILFYSSFIYKHSEKIIKAKSG